MDKNFLKYKNKIIYISGPMSGYKNYNIEEFTKAEVYLQNLGFSSIKNPATIGINLDYRETYEFYLKKAIIMLLESDVLFLIGDENSIKRSKGVQIELKVAKACNIPIIKCIKI